MKRCPNCNRTYTDESLNFCLEDGTSLVNDATPVGDLNATVRYTPTRDTSEPPATEIYRPESPPPSLTQTQPVPPPPPQQWTPTPQPRKKSNAIWWILGGLAAVGVIGVGLIVMIIAIASISSTSNSNNSNETANTRTIGRSANANVNLNSNSPDRTGNSNL
ncbi:MAG: hypothetical protein ABR555_15325, partial [Pyrinomonadaceae bacterium]